MRSVFEPMLEPLYVNLMVKGLVSSKYCVLALKDMVILLANLSNEVMVKVCEDSAHTDEGYDTVQVESMGTS